MIIDDKKLSITFFLNERLKPHTVDDVEEYPIYVQISYDRKNYQFKVNWKYLLFSYILEKRGPIPYYGYVSKENFVDILGTLDSPKIESRYKNTTEFSHKDGVIHLLHLLRKKISKIVDYEVSTHKNKFALKGISSRLEYYMSSIMKTLDLYLNNAAIEVWELEFPDIDPLELAESDYFYENYEPLMRFDLIQSLSFDVQQDLSLYFLTGAFIDSGTVDHTSLNWLSGNLRKEFEEFCLTKIVDDQFLVSIEPKNYFYRYLRLVPPTSTAEWYTERLDQLIRSSRPF